jgi:D-alanine-D-alanine ligase-like ATP-grasp enzyme
VAFSTTRWIEVTVGVVGTKGHTAALHPSLTVVGHGDVLSLEEKFQAGTGVNITPLPATIASAEVLSAARTRIAFAANALDIEGFARIDLFLHVDTGDVMIVEANTVPGLTPSTVLFHQALATNPRANPAAFLKHAIKLAHKCS